MTDQRSGSYAGPEYEFESIVEQDAMERAKLLVAFGPKGKRTEAEALSQSTILTTRNPSGAGASFSLMPDD